MTRLPLKTLRLLCVTGIVCGGLGCQSLSNLSASKPIAFNFPFQLKSPVNLRKGIDASELRREPGAATIDDVSGPMQRILQAARFGGSSEEAIPQSARYDKEFAAAESQFKAGNYAEAQGMLASIIRKTEPPRYTTLALRRAADKKRKYNPVREDAIFLHAESLFEQEKYPTAQSNYALLMKEYPQTRFLDRSTKRLFDIAKNWLGFPDFASSGDIQQINLEDPTSKPAPESGTIPHANPLVPNIFDRSRPVFDTPGRALLALKSIWLNDPTGPLADDALMLTASHHLRAGSYEEADRVFKILREEYPRSPHLKQAFVLGSHVKLMSYQGADYDSTQLYDAERLKKSALKLFPDLPEKNIIKAELKNIEEAKAQRYWKVAQFYEGKGRLQAVLVYCRLLLKEFPKSKYAPNARKLLAEIEPGVTGKATIQIPIFGGKTKIVPHRPGAGFDAPGRVQL